MNPGDRQQLDIIIDLYNSTLIQIERIDNLIEPLMKSREQLRQQLQEYENARMNLTGFNKMTSYESFEKKY